MRRRGVWQPKTLSVVTGAVIALLWGTAEARSARAAAIPFAEAQLFIEYNASDKDAGIQVFFDGDAWKRVTIHDPDGALSFEVEVRQGFRDTGLTEVRLESAEPTLGKILARFPEGTYAFTGKAVDGDVLQGRATLSHDIPAAPRNLSIDVGTSVVSWTWSASGSPSPGDPIQELASFQVILERENDDGDTVASMSIDVEGPHASPTAMSLTVPAAFLKQGRYKAEVSAIATNGNRTIREREFIVP
jgi:hypothetical protein